VPVSFVLKYEALAGDDCYLGGSHGVMCAGDESGFYVQDGTTVSYFPSIRKYHIHSLNNQNVYFVHVVLNPTFKPSRSHPSITSNIYKISEMVTGEEYASG